MANKQTCTQLTCDWIADSSTGERKCTPRGNPVACSCERHRVCTYRTVYERKKKDGKSQICSSGHPPISRANRFWGCGSHMGNHAHLSVSYWRCRCDLSNQFFSFLFLPFALASSRIAVLSGGIIFFVGELGVPSSFNALSPCITKSVSYLLPPHTSFRLFFLSIFLSYPPPPLSYMFSHTHVCR